MSVMVVDGIGQARHLGAVKKRLEPNNRELVLTGGAGVNIPPEYLEREPEMPATFDQKDEGSCVGNMVTTAYGHALMTQMQESVVDPRSRQFAYNNLRIYEGTPLSSDEGGSIGGGFASVAKYGICRESLFPYSMTNLTKTPPPEAYADGANNKIRQYTRVVGLSAIQIAIMRGHILGYGMDVPEQMMSPEVAKTGYVRWIDGQKYVGGHAVVCWGWTTDKDGTLWLIIRNSWGTNWGRQGNFYLDSRFVTESVASDFNYIQVVDSALMAA